VIEHLPRVVAAPVGAGGSGGPDHPMRAVTRQVAFEPGGWTPERRAKVASLFDELASEWHTRIRPGRHDALLDALDRGLAGPLAPTAGPCLEIGSGTGDSTALLTASFDRVIAVDLAREMLLLAPASVAPRLQADGAALPVADGVAAAVVLVNALLFPAEVDRVLAPSGVVVWVNTSGDRTPIHLPVDDVADALPGAWTGRASEAGSGTWGVVWRSDDTPTDLSFRNV